MHAIFLVGAVPAERYRDNGHLGMHVMQPHADDLVVKEGEWSNVAVFPVTFLAHQFGEGSGEILRGVRKVHAHQPRGLQEPLEMVHGSKDEKLLFVVIPVGPKPSKYGGSIIQRVCEYAALCFRIRNNAAAKKCVIGLHRDAHLITSIKSL